MLTRFFFVFVLIPYLTLYWRKKSLGEEGMPNDYALGSVGNALRLLRSFDAEQFRYVILNGYSQEKNHAFYPGYPLSVLLFKVPGKYIEVLGFV